LVRHGGARGARALRCLHDALGGWTLVKRDAWVGGRVAQLLGRRHIWWTGLPDAPRILPLHLGTRRPCRSPTRPLLAAGSRRFRRPARAGRRFAVAGGAKAPGADFRGRRDKVHTQAGGAAAPDHADCRYHRSRGIEHGGVAGRDSCVVAFCIRSAKGDRSRGRQVRMVMPQHEQHSRRVCSGACVGCHSPWTPGCSPATGQSRRPRVVEAHHSPRRRTRAGRCCSARPPRCSPCYS
jgi:hypothetical protein